MNSKLTRTILLASGIGFFVLWILEFRRAGLFESYWLLLVSLICLLFFQFNRLKNSMQQDRTKEITNTSKRVTSTKRTKK
jgi:hypothetical protein